MAVPFQLLALLLCLWSITLVCSFNLEPRIPIVKRGSPKSHFGYTVAQHQTILVTSSGGISKKSWLLVGAPKDQNLQPGTNRSGALWKCPLTTLTDDCQQVKTDGFKNPETGLYNFDYVDESLAEPAEDEIKDDQWLGVTLKSQGPGGKVLVCAHRYMHKGPGFQWGFGLCYILSQTLDLDDYLEPCRGKPVNEGHQQYGFCQAGTSGLLLNDEAVLGVPGPYTWRGTVHTSNISDDFLLKDKTQYFGPVTENDSPVDKYSYLGYSVTAGQFFGNYMSYVGGAPRANETGQVVFFTREKIGESLLRVDLVLQGEMFASSFGFEVLGVDINGDRRDDLIVGAPFYYTSNSSGAIYVYMNNDGGFTENHPYTKIEGAAGESRFGFSMTSLGDLNHDGYKDIAIGAPYEGRGAIYIYLGTRHGLLKTPSQVIHAEDMPGVPYDAFGYSLSGGMDLDHNGYPDLLTSSFCSDRVLLIRARPIIDIQTEVRPQNIENIDPTVKGCAEAISSTETCFSFEACFKMDNNAGTRTGLRLKYTIEEMSDRPIVRVRFDDGQSDQPSIVQRDINLRPEDMGIFQCNTEIVYLLDGPRNILQALKFKLSYEIIQREPRPVTEGEPVPDIDDYPILNQQEALRYFDGTFAKDCGNDDICVSNLDVSGRLDLQKHEKFTYYVLRLGEQDTVSLDVEVTNSGEPAYQSSLLVTHHQALAFDLGESKTGSHQCSRTSTRQVQCSIGNPLVTTTGSLILSFKESGLPFDSKYIQFTVAANSSSTEETPQDPLNFRVQVIKKAEISISGSVDQEQVFYGGEVVGESAIKHMDQIGTKITHKYVIDNQGPWRVNELKVKVLWPHQVENNKDQGKWLLYMTEMPTVDGIGECEIDPSLVNPLILHHEPLPESGSFSGLEVEGELETTDLPGPDGRIPSESGAPTDSELEVGIGGVKITKTVKTTKKVTSSTTVKKQTSKSSSAKEFSASTERTSHGYSSSSSGSSSSRFSSTDYSETGGVDDEIDGSGYGQETGRQHGRTHTRVSRRVYSNEHQSKFPESDLGINTLGGGNFEDEDGNVVSHHEESHSSTRTSPDGRTTLTEDHHESKKVIVKEGSVDDIPSGRWSGGGGYHQTHTRTSSSGETAHIPQRRFQWEEESRTHQSGHRQFQGGIRVDDDISEGSGSYDGFDRNGQPWKPESGIHRAETVNREETIRRTQSGDVSGSFGSYDRHNRSEQGWTASSGTHGTGSDHMGETIRSHTGRNYGDERTHILDSETRRQGSNIHYSDHDRRVPDYNRRIYDYDRDSDTDGRRIYDYDMDGDTSDRRIYDYDRDGDIDRSKGSSRTGNIDSSRQTWSSHGGVHRATDGNNRRVVTEDSRAYGSSDFRRTKVDGFERNVDRDHQRGSSTRIDGEGSHFDNNERLAESQGLQRTHSYDGTSSNWDRSNTNYGGNDRTFDANERSGGSVRTHSGHDRDGGYDRTFDTNERSGGSVRTHSGHDRDGGYDRTFDTNERSGGSVRTHSGHDRDGGYDRTFDTNERSGGNVRTHSGHDREGHRATFDWSDTRRPYKSHNVGESSNTKHYKEHDRLDQDDTRRRTHTYDASVSSTGQRREDGDESRRVHSDGYWGSSGNQGSGSQHSRQTSHTNLRTTSHGLNSAADHHRSNWNTHSAHGFKDHSYGQRGFGDFKDAPDENGTYTRIDVDPETGDTTVYTKRVFARNFQENWEQRPNSERSDSASNTHGHHTRSRRELKRVKREKELIIKPQAITDDKTGKTMQVVNLRCDGKNPTAKCFVFTCNIRNLGAKQAASIRIKSRLWTSTLVEDYPRVSYVSIKSQGSLILPEDIRKDQDESDDVASAETLAYPDLLDQLPPEEVPLWVILVSIFAGLLVLIIIVLILWKLGFFERKRPDPTLSGNLDKDANGY